MGNWAVEYTDMNKYGISMEFFEDKLDEHLSWTANTVSPAPLGHYGRLGDHL